MGASVYSLRNLSDDLMLKEFVRQLRIRLHDPDIRILVRHPSPEFDREYDLRSFQNMEYESREISMRYEWFNGLNPSDDTTHLHRIQELIEKSDLVIVGGDPFIDITIGMYKGLTPYIALITTLCKFHGVPLMLNGIHMCRPLKTAYGRELARFILSNASVVTMREEYTHGILDDMGMKNKRTFIQADMGWALHRAESKLREESRHRFRSQPGTKLRVGITFRNMYWVWDRETSNTHYALMARFIDWLTSMVNAHVFLIPHCTYGFDNTNEDDRTVHGALYERVRQPERVTVVNIDRVDELRGIYSTLDYAMGNRRHTCIMGAINDVPSVSFGEKWHVMPAMAELPELEHLFFPYEELNYENLTQTFTYLVNHREMILTYYRSRVPELARSALGNVDRVVEILKGGII